MLSAPATIPATSAGTFRYAFTPPASRSVNLWPTRLASPHEAANSTTGTSPAHDTKVGSSNTADTAERA